MSQPIRFAPGPPGPEAFLARYGKIPRPFSAGFVPGSGAKHLRICAETNYRKSGLSLRERTRVVI
jgi:hypothetical protein